MAKYKAIKRDFPHSAANSRYTTRTSPYSVFDIVAQLSLLTVVCDFLFMLSNSVLRYMYVLAGCISNAVQPFIVQARVLGKEVRRETHARASRSAF